MITRNDVESLLATLTEIHPNNQGVFSELCRTWLAVDSAPVGHVVGQSGPDGFFTKECGAIVQMDDPASVKGQRVRIVRIDAIGSEAG